MHQTLESRGYSTGKGVSSEGCRMDVSLQKDP